MSSNPHDFKKEIFRKSIHASGLFFLPLLFLNKFIFSGLFVLFLGIYFLIELLDRKNIRLPFLTSITHISKRDNEKNLWARGPIFLSLSCAFLPLVFSATHTCLGLVHIFVSDSAAALIGMKWGNKKIPFSPRKSWAGSIAYFISAFLISLFWVSPTQALLLAVAGSFLEMLPIKDADNLTIPWGIAFLASFSQ